MKEKSNKLPVAPENTFTVNNDREHVDISHRIETVSLEVKYAGKLPVAKERN
jgi:hypothetical protein